MTKKEIIEYLYENNVRGDLTIEQMAEDLADTPQTDCDKCIWNVCNYNKVDWDADTPQTEARYCNECKWFRDKQVCGRCRSLNLFAKADTPQTDKYKVVCPNCGRSDYIRSFEKDFGIKNSGYRYKCINCNTYIKDTPQTDLLVTEYPQDGEVNLIGRDKTEAVVMACDAYKELTEPQTEVTISAEEYAEAVEIGNKQRQRLDKLELFDENGNYIEPQTDCGWK